MHLIGHTAAITQLGQLLAAGTLPHALLIHGPRGVGKATLARALATRLLCGPARAEADMFGSAAPLHPLAADETSPHWHQLQAGSSPDFQVLERDVNPKTKKPSHTIKIEQVRGALTQLARSADGARVVVIDAVDDLTTEAANILLKNLEEPRPGVFFLLICHSLPRCLPTIRSRCRLLRLGVLSPSETLAVLDAHSTPDAPSLVPLAAGCPGRVLQEGGPTSPAALAEALAAVQAYLHGGPTPQAGKDNAPALLEATLRKLAAQATPAAAEAYRTLARASTEAATYNLPLAALLEASWPNLPRLA